MVSDPFYSEGVGHLVNPTNGSWWIVQILSTNEPPSCFSRQRAGDGLRFVSSRI